MIQCTFVLACFPINILITASNTPSAARTLVLFDYNMTVFRKMRVWRIVVALICNFRTIFQIMVLIYIQRLPVNYRHRNYYWFTCVYYVWNYL